MILLQELCYLPLFSRHPDYIPENGNKLLNINRFIDDVTLKEIWIKFCLISAIHFLPIIRLLKYCADKIVIFVIL